MYITVKEYAQRLGISETAAYKRLRRNKYALYVVQDESGRKMINPAIFDIESPGQQENPPVDGSFNHSTDELPAFNHDSTKPGSELPGYSTKAGSIQPNCPGNTVESIARVEQNSNADSTKAGNELPGYSTEIALLGVKLDYAQRDNERLEQQLNDMRRQFETLQQQLTAKDMQIAELNERLRESHIIAHAAQQKPRFFLTGIIDRIRGRKAEGTADATGTDNH